MKNTKSLYHGHRFPAAVISRAVRWYFRFQLSLRDIGELLFERGVIVSYETVRRWCDKFGACFADRVTATRRKPGTTWHLDEGVSRTQAKACGVVLKMGVGLPESACRSRLQCVTNAGVSLRCCTRDGSWPPEIGLQEQISNRPVRLRPKDVVVSDCGKGVIKTSGTC
jgi:hypothetical protein